MAMKRYLMQVMPHGLVEKRRRAAEARRLGASPKAVRSVDPRFWTTRLHLLPEGAVRQIDTVVDVGASTGDWAATVLALAEPTHLTAFEASPLPAKALERRFASDGRVRVLHAAVGAAEGEVSFNITGHPHASSVLEPTSTARQLAGFQVVDRVEVPCLPLDAVVDRPVDLLKIDVQGYEREVIAGSKLTLAQTRWVLVEANFLRKYESQTTFAHLHEAMTAHGFVLIGMTEPVQRLGQPSYADALYARE